MDRSVGEPVAASAAFALAVAELLDELGRVLEDIGQVAYARVHGPAFASATIGGHVRHTLDHVRALVDGVEAGAIEYDHRQRGTAVEAECAAAVAEAERLAGCVRRLAGQPGERTVSVVVQATSGTPAVRVDSTLARELAFVLSHTVHHHATIRSMVIAGGCSEQVPPTFGYAPSTLAYMAK